MDERGKIAWLTRRAGFGLGPGDLDRLESQGVDAVLDDLVDPDGRGVAVAPDPWVGIDLSVDGQAAPAKKNRGEIPLAWIAAMASTPRPLEEWMRWFWHGHLVSTMRVVKSPALMVRQMQMFHDRGAGPFRDLLRAVTVDPAMLLYLDGNTNRKGAVNENYGREVLELFALGIGNFDESEVRVGAGAFTGFRVERKTGEARFDPRSHDDTPRRYLGVEGVHDVDTAIDAIVQHHACPAFVVGRLAKAILGEPTDPARLERLTTQFRDDGLVVRPTVRRLLEAGLDGAGVPLVWAPVPWFAAMVRATGAPIARISQPVGRQLQAAGQLPMDAPNVAGWPSGRAWLSSATTLARGAMAAIIADVAPMDGPALEAATAGDWTALADALGRPEGFTSPTQAALGAITASAQAGRTRLTVAMASPDMVVI